MSVLLLPVFKIAVGYQVSYGRRWSALEHLLLLETVKTAQNLSSLSAKASLPRRLIIEALTNLLRAGWIEVRSGSEGAIFSATPTGKRRAVIDDLPAEVKQRVRWITFCVERLTGSSLRANDLELVYPRDRPDDIEDIESRIGTFEADDESRRNLVYLDRDETFDRFVQIGRAPSRAFARVEVQFGLISGLPDYASLALRSAILEKELKPVATAQSPVVGTTQVVNANPTPKDELKAEDFVVGGQDHLSLLKQSLAEANSHVVLHSCFLHPETVESLLPDLEAAAQRKVKVDLLWGLRDLDTGEVQPALSAVQQVLNKLNSSAKERIQLSPFSSGSHAKVLLYDNRVRGGWETVIGSCNFLSSYFSLLETSIHTRSRVLALQVMGQLIEGQLPSSGAWTPVVKRLNRTWNKIRSEANSIGESGAHSLTLLVDGDHHAVLRTARDEARSRVIVGCDLYGIAAETSVVPPMARAAELGAKVQLYYRRPTKQLAEEAGGPNIQRLEKLGLEVKQLENLHGKFIFWDEGAAAATSFNWMSATASGARVRGAEIGVLVRGPGICRSFGEKLAISSLGAIGQPSEESGSDKNSAE